jgi:hypothetical protein
MSVSTKSAWIGVRRTAFLLALLALGSAAGSSPLHAHAQGGESRAGLVIRFSDGSVRQYCLAFPGETTTGMDLLVQTGLNVTYEAFGGMGGMVCKIEGDGCDYPAQPCVCQSYGPDGVYWSYHHLKEGKWNTSVVGAGSYKVRNGDVEGWAWSEGDPPPVFSFEQICGAAVPAPTNTSPPPTPIPAPTGTRPAATATSTPRPAATASPTVTQRAAPPPATPTEAAAAPVPTATSEPTYTQTATATQSATASPDPTATNTSTPARSLPASPTPTPPVALSLGMDPRAVGILVGLGAAIGFVALLALFRARRGPEGDEFDGE